IVNDDILKNYSSKTSKKNSISSSEKEAYRKRIKEYKQFYNAFIVITQKMLAGEELLPATEWNLDDFEGSVPLDYRKLIP
ncbi:hypothetical protein, partial [Desulfovibrio porci]|uniref:hypothetical protein n=1 Tax=Desulfovibrio porci TaxID=2605782 RepID=UPI003A8E5F7A